MIKQTNFKAYANKGKLSNFKDTKEINDYRKQQLLNYSDCTNFIKHLFNKTKINVIDIGSGCSGLLYSLYNENLLNSGVGIEQSKNYHKFAELWKKDSNYNTVTNICGDALQIEYNSENMDLFLILDSTFPLLAHENEKYPSLLLNKAYKSLKKEGIIIIEFNNFHPLVISGGTKLFCKEFPNTDNFKYGMYKQTYNPKSNMVQSESIYIKNNLTVSTKEEYVYYYRFSDLQVLLEAANFKVLTHFSDFNGTPFNEELSEKLVIIGKK